MSQTLDAEGTMTGKFKLLLVVILLAAVRPASAQRFMYTGTSDGEVLSFLTRLQKAVGAGDRTTVAALIKYPLRVNHNEKRHESITTSAQLLKQYDAIFTPKIRQSIVKQTPAKLTGGRDGVAIDAGAVWLNSSCDRSQPPKCKMGVSSVNLHESK